MPKAVELLTSTEVFHDLHVAVDNRRQSVRVDRQAVLNLLIDHSVMLNALKGAGVAANSPAPQRHRAVIKL